MSINFYHLTQTPLGKALPKLLEKVLSNNLKAVIQLGNEEQVEQLNRELWTYTTKVFLPHGSAKDGRAERQPIYITACNENPNNADVLVFTNSTKIEADLNKFKKCLYMFDANNESELQNARQKWRDYQSKGLKTTYWRQTPKGTWETGT